MEPELNDEEKALMKVYEWIDTIPLSRDKKNIARDFSDGMLLAEMIKHFYPRLIEVHNYPAASSTKQKQINWNTLNIKAFKKLGFNVAQREINDIIASKPKAIERLLIRLYELITKQTIMTKPGANMTNGNGSGNESQMNEKKAKEYETVNDIEEEIKRKQEEFAMLTNRRQEIENQLLINNGISDNLQYKIRKISKMLQV